jgi:uncharacterized RDD family membrane protein YckC
MEFLPIYVDGQRVYAGFWVRAGAFVLDMVVLLPVIATFFYLEKISFSSVIVLAVISGFLFDFYNIYFNGKYGGTLGKLALDIRITRPDGREIGWSQALLRSCVDLSFHSVLVAFGVYALMQIDREVYLSAGVFEQDELLEGLYPAWYSFVDRAANVWYWSELVVLLLNKRKRALHDFIAGTVVIHRQFVQQSAERDTTEGFHYWRSEKIPSLLRTYWIGSVIVFTLAVGIAIVWHRPLVFFVFGFMPYYVLLIVRIVRKPFLNLGENLKTIDPNFYELLVQKGHDMHSLNILTSLSNHSKHREGRLQAAFLNWEEDTALDQRLVFYRRNVKRFINSSMAILSLWFLTSFVLLFVSSFAG